MAGFELVNPAGDQVDSVEVERAGGEERGGRFTAALVDMGVEPEQGLARGTNPDHPAATVEDIHRRAKRRAKIDQCQHLIQPSHSGPFSGIALAQNDRVVKS